MSRASSEPISLYVLVDPSHAAAALAVAFGDTRGEEPALECVEDGIAPSESIDRDQHCEVTVTSWNEYAEWQSQPQSIRAVGLLAGVAGVGLAHGVGDTAIVQKTRNRTCPTL